MKISKIHLKDFYWERSKKIQLNIDKLYIE